ncbi:HAD family hydrolase [Halobacteriales archaeon QS_6_71_20]|nr:MAG: HAD family hydrolase [Halobacteriales archaeon QS_6_71_20]
MTNDTVSAVVFDLDDTLCTRDQDPRALYDRAFERADVAPFGEPAELWSALTGPPDPNDERAYFAAGFVVVAARNGRPDVDATALADGLLASVDHGAVSFAPGGRDAFAAARERGPVAVLTNGPEWRQAPKLSALGLADALDAVVYAGDMARRKPHPDPFERVCSLLGTDPAETLYVGDSLEHDVAGAQGAGLPAAWIPGPREDPPVGDDGRPDPRPFAPEYVLATLAEFDAAVPAR